MVNILCIGDVHIQVGNIQIMDEFFLKLEKLITDPEKEIDFVILMGDILHTHERLHTTAFNCAVKLFTLLSTLKETFVLVGNHDLINNSQFLTDNHWMNCFKNYKNLTIVDDITLIKRGKGSSEELNLVLSPYVPDGKFKNAVDKLISKENIKLENIDCFFAHQLFDKAKMGAIVAENVEEWKKENPLLISGHIHDKQKIQDNLYYTGSSLQHAFGESADKTILLLKLSKVSEVFEEIDLDLPKKKILYMDINDLENFDISTLNRERTQYKLVVDGNFQQFETFRKTSKYKDIIKNDIKIAFKQKRSFIQSKKDEMKKNKNPLSKETKKFTDILYELIRQENNILLKNLMDEVINNKNTNKTNEDDEIIILDE